MREWSAEVTVDAELATRLIRERFPDVELRSISLLGEGWDNTMWIVDELLEAASELPDVEPTATCPCVDLVLYWALPPDGRSEFLDDYGAVTEEQLLRARVLSLFLCGVLAVYGDTSGGRA